MKKLNRKTLKSMGAGQNFATCIGDPHLCPLGSHCHNGKCILDEPIGPCFNDACPPGYHCLLNQCVR